MFEATYLSGNKILVCKYYKSDALLIFRGNICSRSGWIESVIGLSCYDDD